MGLKKPKDNEFKIDFIYNSQKLSRFVTFITL